MKKDKETIHKEKLIMLGVGKLKKFGFVNVNKTNITTDEVYSLYFSKMLREINGCSFGTDTVANQLLDSMKIAVK